MPTGYTIEPEENVGKIFDADYRDDETVVVWWQTDAGDMSAYEFTKDELIKILYGFVENKSTGQWGQQLPDLREKDQENWERSPDQESAKEVVVLGKRSCDEPLEGCLEVLL